MRGSGLQSKLPEQHPSPKPAHAITVKRRVITQNWNVLRLGLGNQHAVEGIFVWSGKQSGSDSMVDGDSQRLETFQHKNAGKLSG